MCVLRSLGRVESGLAGPTPRLFTLEWERHGMREVQSAWLHRSPRTPTPVRNHAWHALSTCPGAEPLPAFLRALERRCPTSQPLGSLLSQQLPEAHLAWWPFCGRFPLPLPAGAQRLSCTVAATASLPVLCAEHLSDVDPPPRPIPRMPKRIRGRLSWATCGILSSCILSMLVTTPSHLTPSRPPLTGPVDDIPAADATSRQERRVHEHSSHRFMPMCLPPSGHRRRERSTAAGGNGCGSHALSAAGAASQVRSTCAPPGARTAR